MADSSMLSDIELEPDIDEHITDHPRQPAAAAAAAAAAGVQKQQQQQQQEGGMWIHALLPSQLSEGCIPAVSITQSTVSIKGSIAAGKGRPQALPADSHDECLLLLDNASMQQMQPAGQHFTYWCLGPVETGHWPQSPGNSSNSSSRVTRAVAVSLHLPSRGLAGFLAGGRASKAVQLQQELLPGCTNQFVLQPCSVDIKHTQTAAAAAAAAAAGEGVSAAGLAAAMAAALLQKLQRQQLLPGVVRQLQDLLQHCSSYSSGNSAWGVSDSSSSNSSRGNKTHFIAQTVLLLARQLPTMCASELLKELTAACAEDSTSTCMDWEPDNAAAAAVAAAAPAGADEGVQAPHHESIQLPATAVAKVAAAVLQAYAGVRLLSSLSADAVRCLPESIAQQLQQAVSACLRVLSVLSHAHQLPPQGSTPTAANTSGSNSSSRSASVSWLQQLQQCLRGGLSANAPPRALQCCDLQNDAAWLAALPALVGLMQRPSLGFLYTLHNLPRQQTNFSYSYWQQPTQQQQQGQYIRAASAAVADATVGQFADVVLLVFRQLAAISRELLADAASGALLAAVLALAPSLQDLLQLQQQLPPLPQELNPPGRSNGYNSYNGSHITAAHRIRVAVDAAMQQATVEDLVQCWSCIAAQGMQESLRQAMQQAVVAAVLRMKDSSCSSAAGHGSSNRAGSFGYLAAAAAPLASAVNSGNNDMLVDSPSWEMLCSDLLFGGLFEAGPMQLLHQLLQCQSSSSSTSRRRSSCWPPFVSYHLVPAALQQLLSATAGMAATAGAEAAAAPAAAAAAAAAEADDEVAKNRHAAQPANRELYNTSEIEQQQQRQQQQGSPVGQINADVLVVVRQWLLQQPVPASSTSTARTRQQRSVAELYCAAEQLLQHCPILHNTKSEDQAIQHTAAAAAAAAAGHLPSGQQLDNLQAPEEDHQQQPDASMLRQGATPAGDAASCCSTPSLLHHLLHVLASEVTSAVLLQGQLLQVLQAVRVVGDTCSAPLQQHFLQTIQQSLAPVSTATAAPVISSSTSAAGSGACAQHAELQQRLNSSKESADVYVSAVLGCAAGSKGCSSLLHGSCTDTAGQQKSSGTAASVAAAADGPWQAVRSKRQRQQYSQGPQQQQQQQQFEGVSTLQRQVLLLLADCLGSAEASVECSGSTGSDTVVPLLQCTDDLLAGHALWLKLLYGLCIAVQQDTGLDTHNASSSSSGVLSEHLCSKSVSHPVVCKLVSSVCSLIDQLQSVDIQVSQLQQLQLQHEPLLKLTAAVHAVQQAALLVASHATASSSSSSSSSSCNVAAVSAALAAAEAALQQHSHQQQLLESFYSLLCPSLGATLDLDAHVADLSSIEARLQQVTSYKSYASEQGRSLA
jgi:hypothetical protein